MRCAAATASSTEYMMGLFCSLSSHGYDVVLTLTLTLTLTLMDMMWQPWI